MTFKSDSVCNAIAQALSLGSIKSYRETADGKTYEYRYHFEADDAFPDTIFEVAETPSNFPILVWEEPQVRGGHVTFICNSRTMSALAEHGALPEKLYK